jgi:hypothetical protein
MQVLELIKFRERFGIPWGSFYELLDFIVDLSENGNQAFFKDEKILGSMNSMNLPRGIFHLEFLSLGTLR